MMDKDFLLKHATEYAIYQGCDEDKRAEYANWYLAYCIENDYIPDHPNVFWVWVRQCPDHPNVFWEWER